MTITMIMASTIVALIGYIIIREFEFRFMFKELKDSSDRQVAVWEKAYDKEAALRQEFGETLRELGE